PALSAGCCLMVASQISCSPCRSRTVVPDTTSVNGSASSDLTFPSFSVLTNVQVPWRGFTFGSQGFTFGSPARTSAADDNIWTTTPATRAVNRNLCISFLLEGESSRCCNRCGHCEYQHDTRRCNGPAKPNHAVG